MGSARVACAVAATALALGCTSVDRAAAPADGTQALYRLEISRGAEAFSGRLVLRELGAEWELELADALGRAVWAWRVRGQKTAWIDLNARTWCPSWRGGMLATLPHGLAASGLRAVLRGRLPDPGLEPQEDGPFVVQRHDAVWRGERREGVLVWWSYARPGGVTWSWRGDPRQGELEASDGLEMRWRRVVIEPLAQAGRMHPLVPEGYRRDCRELDLP